VGECPSGEALAQSRRTPAPSSPSSPSADTHKIISSPSPDLVLPASRSLCLLSALALALALALAVAALSLLPAVCCTAAALHHAARECPPPSAYPRPPPPSRACPLWVLPPVLAADYSHSTPNPTYVVAFVAPPKASKPASHPARQQSFTSHLLRPPLLPISSRDVDQSALHHTALRSWFLSW
jgi:hypothetical protein